MPAASALSSPAFWESTRSLASALATVVLSLESSSPDDPMVELSYDEGGGGWWPLSTLVFAAD